MKKRLDIDALAALPADVRKPGYRVDAAPIGVVHIGVGNFHRAHQAVAFDRLMSAGDVRWGICGVSLRRSAMRDALAPQQGLYSIIERERNGSQLTVIGALRELHAASDGLGPVVERIADRQVAVVTLTVTEKGYDEGGPTSAAGLLAAGLARRHAVGGSGLTAISCDNLQHNGVRLRERVLQQAAVLEPGLAGWIEKHVSFPSGMVDRIVPATTDADRAEAAALLGCVDAWPVPAEPFYQWVLEDRFAGERPALESAGVQMVEDVSGWEAMKLRLLNATHSAFAYFGASAGLETVDEAVAEPRLRRFIERLWREVQPTLPAAVYPLVANYTQDLLERWANPAIHHRLTQIAMDGSRKLPQRLIAPLRERRAQQLPARAMAETVAAWMHWVGGVGDDGAPHPVDDPLAARLRAAADAGDARATVQAMLAFEEVFGADLRDDGELVDELTDALATIREKGTLGALDLFAARDARGR